MQRVRARKRKSEEAWKRIRRAWREKVDQYQAKRSPPTDLPPLLPSISSHPGLYLSSHQDAPVGKSGPSNFAQSRKLALEGRERKS